jgi:hypothetical protein
MLRQELCCSLGCAAAARGLLGCAAAARGMHTRSAARTPPITTAHSCSPRRPLARCRYVDIQSADGAVALHEAAWYRARQATACLLAAGASQHVRSRGGFGVDSVCTLRCYPLHLAAVRGDITTAKILLQDYVGGERAGRGGSDDRAVHGDTAVVALP